MLSYEGPDVPYQELYAANETTTLRTVTSNAALLKQIANYNLPNITYTEIGPGPGTEYTLNAMTQYPRNFNPTKKYPVILTPYGGPGAQEVAKTFKAPSWNQYISSDPELEYITYTVDNGGTRYKGRAFRATVTEKLGVLEAKDQIWAANDPISRYELVDADHVALWGWSYGGFLTSKVLETQGLDAGPITLGLITAPVTDWRFYDSMYTERYMRTPSLNPGGYKVSRVSDPTGFSTVPGGFAIMHGMSNIISLQFSRHWQIYLLFAYKNGRRHCPLSKHCSVSRLVGRERTEP
jgi:dipeptidyl-peptidase-4